MQREQDDDREDDSSETHHESKQVTPALAGLTTLLAASPILSVCPGKEVEEEKVAETHERKCIRIPGGEGVIIPLHGDSDEEINPGRYADPSLVTMQKTDEPSVGKPKPKSLASSTRQRKDKSPKRTKKKSKPEESEKLVLPALAGLATVIAATPIITEPAETVEPKKDDSQVRKFIRTSNESALHRDSDGPLHPDRYDDPSLLAKQPIDGPVIEEYIPPPGVEIPLMEEQSKIVEEPPDKKSSKKKAAPQPPTKDVPQTLPALAGLTTLLAASPMLSTTPDPEAGASEAVKEEVHEVKYIRIPDGGGVIIPLHGDSDEEINPERYKDPSLVGVQKVGETMVEDRKPTKKSSEPKEKKTNHSRDEAKKENDKTPSTGGKTVMPLLAGMTTLLAASPILAVSPSENTESEEKEKEGPEVEAKQEEVRERKYIRIPNEEGVIIPLHGDSDEELNPERYKDPSLQGVQRIGDHVEEIKSKKSVKPVESKSSKSKEPKGKIVQGDDNTPLSGEKLVTPMLAGLTTLLAASPILTVSPPNKEEGDEEGKEIKSESEEKHEIAQEDKPLERKVIRIPDRKDVVIIPLHGDSDEELHPERYEDPSMSVIEKIEGPTMAEIVAPTKEKKSKVVKIKKTAEKAKQEAAKMVTPMLAGMTTLLAASPILTVSSPPSNTNEESEENKENVEENISNGNDAENAAQSEEKPMERKVIRIPDRKDGVIIPLHGDSDEELHPERYEDPSMSVIETIEGPTMAEIEPPVKEKKSKVVKMKKTAEKAKHEVGKMVTPMLAGMTTLLAASPILTVSPEADENKKLEDTGESKSEGGSEITNAEKPIERKVIRIPDNKTEVIVPLHGDSDEEIHPERYTDPSLTVIQKIEGPTMAEIVPLDVKPKKAKVRIPNVTKIKRVAENATKEAAQRVTPMLYGMATLLGGSKEKCGKDVEKREEAIVEDKEEVKDVKQKIETESDKIENDFDGEQEQEEEEEIERMFIRMPNQEGLIVPLHGESDEELHPDRYENPELQGVHSIAGSVVEEGILPPAKPIRSRAKPKPETQTTNDEEKVQQQNINEVHLARDHDYEPVNPREPPPSPPAAVRKSRADAAEEKKTVALGLLKTASFDSAELPQRAAPVEKPAETPAVNPEEKPVEKPDGKPGSPSATKSVTASLAALTTLQAASPILSVSSDQEKEPEEEKKDEVIERKFIRIPNDATCIIIPLHGDSDEELHPERYKDPSLQGIQRIEGPTLELPKPKQPQTPTPHEHQTPKTPTLQEHQTPKTPTPQAQTAPKESEYEVVLNPEDMAIDEALPLSFQDRCKAGAGEIRDKFRNMHVPKIKIERPDLSKVKFPERPQFLKERPQFLKERPQFLKERPQFLKERPQFLKERPQFLKEKPKFLTQRPTFNVTLPDRSKFKVPERLKFKRSAKIDKPKIRKPNPSSMRRPLRDVVTISSESSPNFFDTLKEKTGSLKAKAYPKFLSLRRRNQRERVAQLRMQTSQDTESSPPSPPDSRKLFPERYRDIRFADEEEQKYGSQRMDVQSEEGFEESTAPFHEKEVPMKAKIDSSSDIGESDKEQISSGASSMKHRTGVLEEIDSDEFFLRQKGLSREDVDVSRYLSKEIRDAFRPQKPAVSHMDSTEGYDDEFEDEESPDPRYQSEAPEPPERKRSSQRSESRESDFNTFPIRPTRRKQSQGSYGSHFGSKEVFEKVKKPPRRYRSKSDTRSSLRSLDRRSILDYATPRPPSRQKSSRSLTRSRPESATDLRGGSVRRDVAREMEIAPVKPLRKSRSRGASMDERTSRGADSLPHDYVEYEQEEEEEIEDEEEEMELQTGDYEPTVQERQQTFRVVPVSTNVTVGAAVQDDESIPGYATVRKTRPPRPPAPPKSRKEQLQSQLHSIKAQGINFFQTFPRRAMKSLNKPRLPVRPRYPMQFSPVRPPRRNRVFREPVYVEGDLNDDRDTRDSYDLKHEYEDARDLQRGEIVERMKGRPLPAPPRPPRRRDDESITDSQLEDIEDQIEMSETQTPSRNDEFLSSLRVSLPDALHAIATEEDEIQTTAQPHPTMETSQQTSFELPDVSVSIQTDPLPAGYVVDEQAEQLRRDLPERMRIMEETIARQEAALSQHDPRRLFDPDVVRESEDQEDFPPPLPQRGATMIPPPITIPPVQVSFPDRLHLAQLDVDKLNVNELQANRIKVSDIDSVTMQISEISGASGNLILNGVELPPDFIKNLVAQIPVPEPPKPVVVVQEKIIERVRETTPQPHMKRMVTPPPPIVVQHAMEEAPTPPVMQASTTEQLPKPVTARTRRKSPTRVVDDVEDELASVVNERERRERERLEKEALQRESERESRPKMAEPKVALEPEPMPSTSGQSASAAEAPSSAAAASPLPSTSGASAERTEPTAFNLIKQLCTLWYRNIISGAESLAGGINSIFPDNDKRRDAQTAAVILIIIIAALILLSLGADQSVHHHHWDYLNPPRS